MVGLPPSFFEHLEDRLNLAVYDTNQEWYGMNVTTHGGRVLRTDAAPEEEATITVQVTVKPMSTKLQGLAAKIAKFKHDAEFEAGKLDEKIEGAAGRMPGVFSGAHGAIDGLTKQFDDVEATMKDIQAATNGGPA